MTDLELDEFLVQHGNMSWRFENEDDKPNSPILFRNDNLPWYQEDPNHATRVSREKLNEITPEVLLKAINGGLDVEWITRVTGYFAKVSGFNPGKLGELADRHREQP